MHRQTIIENLMRLDGNGRTVVRALKNALLVDGLALLLDPDVCIALSRVVPVALHREIQDHPEFQEARHIHRCIQAQR